MYQQILIQRPTFCFFVYKSHNVGILAGVLVVKDLLFSIFLAILVFLLAKIIAACYKMQQVIYRWIMTQWQDYRFFAYKNCNVGRATSLGIVVRLKIVDLTADCNAMVVVVTELSLSYPKFRLVFIFVLIKIITRRLQLTWR